MNSSGIQKTGGWRGGSLRSAPGPVVTGLSGGFSFRLRLQEEPAARAAGHRGGWAGAVVRQPAGAGPCLTLHHLPVPVYGLGISPTPVRDAFHGVCIMFLSPCGDCKSASPPPGSGRGWISIFLFSDALLRIGNRQRGRFGFFPGRIDSLRRKEFVC